MQVGSASVQNSFMGGNQRGKVLTSASHCSPSQAASQLHVEVAAVHTPFSEQSSSLLHEFIVIASTESAISIMVGWIEVEVEIQFSQ